MSPKAMLLSVERPFVGAFAFLIPGATLRHRSGLVQQSCRRRLNMANGHLSSVVKDQGDNGQGDGRPGTFDLLGFTHYWGRSLRGYWVIKQKTAASRFSRAVRSIDSWCRDNRHLSISEQQQKLNEKLRGHYP
jgi:hypothetical protein